MKSPGTDATRIFTPGDSGQVVLGWLIHAHKGRQRHDLAARRCDRGRLWLGAPAAVFSAIVGTSVFAALEKGGSEKGAWNVTAMIIAAISITSAILTGLGTFLNLSERAEKHRSAGVRYKEVIRELERMLGGGVDGLTQADPSLAAIQKRLDDLEESAPIVPERIFDRVEKQWSEHGMVPVDKAAALYQSKSQAGSGDR